MSEKIVQLNEEIIKGQLKELVRGSVEETLNELLEKEAESLTQAARYERSEARKGYRSGHYDRNLTTTSGDVTLHVPRLKGVSFETAIIERYRRRESSVEEALIEMYLAGVSVRRVEDITEALWGSKVSPATISELNKNAYIIRRFLLLLRFAALQVRRRGSCGCMNRIASTLPHGAPAYYSASPPFPEQSPVPTPDSGIYSHWPHQYVQDREHNAHSTYTFRKMNAFADDLKQLHNRVLFPVL